MEFGGAEPCVPAFLQAWQLSSDFSDSPVAHHEPGSDYSSQEPDAASPTGAAGQACSLSCELDFAGLTICRLSRPGSTELGSSWQGF